jgi:hypothetical protein
MPVTLWSHRRKLQPSGAAGHLPVCARGDARARVPRERVRSKTRGYEGASGFAISASVARTPTPQRA